MKLVKHFDAFLTNEVNLNETRIQLIGARTSAVRSFLKQDEVFGTLVQELIPQGSFAQKTIIRPRPNGHFDADLLVRLSPVPDWQPEEYVGKLYTALGRSAAYKEMRHRRTRCVYLDYADEFHMDLVPYVEDDDGGWITNNKTKSFEAADSAAFTAWLKARHKDAGGNLIKVVRLLKYVRDISWGFNVKSVIFTTLLGARVDLVNTLLDPGCYADVPSTLKRVVGDLDDYLQANPTMPAIYDPGGTGDRFDQRWDQASYASFSKKISSLRVNVDSAFDAEGVEESVAAWQNVFGDKFKALEPAKTSAKRSLVLSEGKALAPDTEEFLDRDFGFPIVSTSYSVRMVGRVRPQNGFMTYSLPERGNKVGTGRALAFEIKQCTVPKPYEVFWKVRNTGPHAEAIPGGLRGEITRDGGYEVKTETTSYVGSHWVECYVVKDKRCVAFDRQPVIVT